MSYRYHLTLRFLKFKSILNVYRQRNYKDFLSLAEKGDIDAQMIVASMLIGGQGIQRNIREGQIWRKKAADQNDVQAQYLYGWYCLENHDFFNGQYYLHKASSKNYIKALHDEANLLEYGDFGYKKDINTAIKLYQKACLLGCRKSCKYLYSILVEIIGKKKAKQYIKNNIGCFNFNLLIMLGINFKKGSVQ